MSSTEDDDEPTCPCKTEISNSLMIECAECETSYHPICCGLDGITGITVKKLKAKKWKCPRCFTFPETFPEPMQKSTTKLTTQTVEEIIAIVNSTVEDKLTTLLAPENLNQTNENDEVFTTVNRRRRHNSIQKVMREEKEEEILIEKKKKNLIVFSMPESSSDEKRDEMLEDFQKIKELYKEKVVVNKEDIEHITRLGTKGPQKTRPILITLKSENKRKELLTKNMNLKLLEESTSINIYVSPDLTRKQRDADKALRQELKQRKITNPNLVIRSNKIVPFRHAAQGAPSWASLFD